MIKPAAFRAIDARVLDVIPVLDDPGGHRLIIAPQLGAATLDFIQVAALRNYLSTWLDTNRKAHTEAEKK